MTTSSRLVPFLAACVCVAATAVRAERPDRLRGDDCVDQMSRVVVDVIDSDDVSAEPSVVELIVPCAMVDSGALGPDCAAADFYVVNEKGTLLCRVDVATLAAAAKPASVDDGPPAETSSRSPVAPVAAQATTSFSLAVPLIVDVPRAPVGPGLDAGLDLVATQLRPS